MPDDALVDATMQAVHQIARSVYILSSRHPILQNRTPAQIRALGFLDIEQTKTVGELADLMGVTISTASGLVDKLVEENLVERSTNPEDRRQVLIRLAPAAEAMKHEIKGIRTRQVRAALATLDSDRHDCFLESIQAIAAALANLDHLEPEVT
ncbi:MAG: MarR family transcriptional regulator [Thermomicrobiales bacterium]|nr:MarR family transcriptional regulator [Thermomicrobiales bacterium]